VRERSTDRDRDAAGRPRNARPRDGLGRPLGRPAASRPGADGAPAPSAVPLPGSTPVPGQALPPARALAVAQQLLDAGRPFHAHEVLEESWKAAPPGERELWRGLAQLAVGVTHARRGNARGAVALLRRGAGAVGGYAGDCPHEVDAAGLAAAARALAGLIETGGLAAVPAGALALRLSRPPG
jgi:uncharacterized protein